jgi:hypothetical protein
MPIFSANKDTRKVLKNDVTLILHLIADSRWIDNCPLTGRGRVIVKMLWKENKSFSEVAKHLSLKQERVVQIYHMEIRRLTYFLDSAFKELTALQQENQSHRKEKKAVKAITHQPK